MSENLNYILNNLITDISNSESVKSSHWQFFTENFRVDFSSGDVKGISGFGQRSPRNILRQTYHSLLQRVYFSNIDKYWNFSEYHQAKHMTDQQNRSLDLDVLRHVFTFNFLCKNCILGRSKLQRGCVIGDGQSNFCSLAHKMQLFDKLVSVNLPEVLLSDLKLILAINDIQANQICYVNTDESLELALENHEIKLILIAAQNCNILENKSIQFFANIASMQEMTPSIVQNYFEIIKSNKSIFYCCNRETKTLFEGEELVFDDYPWDTAEILIDELCPWHQYYYKPNGVLKLKQYYDGPTRHRIVQF